MLAILLLWLCAAGVAGKRCTRVVPGLNRQARGVDVTNLDLMPLDPVSAEDGYKYPVISYTCDEGKTRVYEEVTYDVPDQVWIISDNPTASLSATATVVKTSRDARKSFSSNTGLDGKIFDFGFSKSESYSRAQRTLAKHEKIVEFVPVHFGGRRVDLHLEDTLSLGRAAQRRLERLPANYTADPAGYENFVKQFGTHYIAGAQFGGLMMTYMETSSDYLEQHDETTVEEQAKVSFWGFLGSKRGSTTTQSQVDTDFLKKTTNVTRYYGGTANLLDSDGLSAWQPTISTNPWLASAGLERLSSLVSSENRREALDTAITDYVLRAYLTAELPRIINTLPTSVRTDPRAKAVLTKINTLAEQRPLPESDVQTLGQEVEKTYAELFVEYHRQHDSQWWPSSECPAGKTIYRIDNLRFGCSFVPGLGVITDCTWKSGSSCPGNGVLKGWRQGSVLCCQIEGATTTHCDTFATYGKMHLLSTEILKGFTARKDDDHYQFSVEACSLHYT